jgi:hypothetical protein
LITVEAVLLLKEINRIRSGAYRELTFPKRWHRIYNGHVYRNASEALASVVLDLLSTLRHRLRQVGMRREKGKA